MTTALLLLIAASQPEATSRRSVEPIALVYAAVGQPSLRLTGRTFQKIDVVRSLPDGTELQVPAGASLRVAYADGRRFVLQGPAHAVVTASGLRDSTGGVKTLEAVPPLPRLPSIRLDETGGRIAAIRLRSGASEELVPHAGAVVLAEDVLLRFGPVGGATRYAVEVRDSRGQQVFQIQATSTSVRLPATSLEPGKRYTWSVEAVDGAGERHEAVADFVTLSSELLAERSRLREAAGAEDPLLLSAVDRELGLSTDVAESHIADGR